MTNSGFAAQLAQDLDPEDLRMVLGVFRQDVERLTGVLDANVTAGDVAAFQRTCHGLAGAAGAVGAAALEQACRIVMTSTDLRSADLAARQTGIRALGAAALDEMGTFLAVWPEA